MTIDDLATAHRIIRLEPATPAKAVVLLLHGGKPASAQTVDSRSASWRRMAAVQRAVAPALLADGDAVWLLRYRERGWNDAAPVLDVRSALDDVRAAHGDLPVVLLGHSMGARAAVHAADDDSVVGVVGLAPWWGPEDPVAPLAGKPVVAAHGRSDRITSARMTRAYLDRADRVASSVEMVDMGRVGHYMLRRVAAWNDVATRSVLSVLHR